MIVVGIAMIIHVLDPRLLGRWLPTLGLVPSAFPGNPIVVIIPTIRVGSQLPGSGGYMYVNQ